MSDYVKPVADVYFLGQPCASKPAPFLARVSVASRITFGYPLFPEILWTGSDQVSHAMFILIRIINVKSKNRLFRCWLYLPSKPSHRRVEDNLRQPTCRPALHPPDNAPITR